MSNHYNNFLDESYNELIRDRLLGENETNSNGPSKTNGDVLVNTFRLYGSMYISSVVLYIILRRYYPKLFSIRSWVPEIASPIAISLSKQYNWISWSYQVFNVSDDDLFEHCGMDTLCFLRALRFGRILCLVGCFNALYLIPLYVTADMSLFDNNENNNTNATVTNSKSSTTSVESSGKLNILALMSISNLPSSSRRFIAPVIAAYTFFLYAMYLIVQEYYWFIKWRHRFLGQKKPQNYTCYVAGIPEEYRSSYKLLQYFQDCAGSTHHHHHHHHERDTCNVPYDSESPQRSNRQIRNENSFNNDWKDRVVEDSAVYEAHIAMDTPKLDRLVSRRDVVIKKLEHSVFVQRHTGREPVRNTLKLPSILPFTNVNNNNNNNHHEATSSLNDSNGCTPFTSPTSPRQVFSRKSMSTSISSIQRVNAIHSYQEELHQLNRTIQQSIHTITCVNDRYRSHLTVNKHRPSRNLHIILSSDDEDDENYHARTHDTTSTLQQEQPQSFPTRTLDDMPSTTESDPLLGVFASTNTGILRLSRMPTRKADNNVQQDTDCEVATNHSHSNRTDPRITLDQIVEEASDQFEVSPHSQQQHQEHVHNEQRSLEASSRETILIDFTGPARTDSKLSDALHETIIIDVDDDDDDYDYNDAEGTPPLPPLDLTMDNNNPKSTMSLVSLSTSIQPNSLCNYNEPNTDIVEIRVTSSDSEKENDNNRDFVNLNKLVVSDCAIESSGDPVPVRGLSVQRKPESVTKDKESGELNNVSTSSKMSDNTLSDSSNASVSLSSSGRLSDKVASMHKLAKDGAKHVTFKAAVLATTASMTVAATSRAATQSISDVTRRTGETIVKVSKDLHADKVIQTAGEQFINVTDQAKQVGSTLIASAGAVAPILLSKTEGQPRTSGFVVFANLYTAQTAIQMIHHPKPYVMDVIAAPAPDDIFWRNVGLPFRARRGGILAAAASTGVLCFFWTVPMSFISSLTELSSLKSALPNLGRYLDDHSLMEKVFAQIAPLVLLFFNEAVLPVILKHFATWEGHISASMLEASLFTKLGVFMVRTTTSSLSLRMFVQQYRF
jgi:Late exocytosis, associated with Golgi transport/Calcium-dependent channel, 7TM region, putative phosphate